MSEINLATISEDALREEIRRRHPRGRPIKWGPCQYCHEEFSTKMREMHEPYCDKRPMVEPPPLPVPREAINAAHGAGRTWALKLAVGSAYATPETLALVYHTKQEREAFVRAAKTMLKKRGVLTNGARVISVKPFKEAKV